MPELFIVEPEETAPAPNVDGDVLSVPITAEVGGWGFTLRELLNALRGFSGSRIDIPINTYGGEVFEGLAIYNTLKGRSEEIVTRVVGYAVSMGSVLLMAGSRREMPERGYIMIHNPTMGAYGDAEDVEGVKALLDKMTNTLAEIYAQVTGLTKKRILRMMDDETWLDAKEALALGFVTHIVPGAEIRAHLSRKQLEGFHNVPAALLESKKDDMKINEQLLAAMNKLADKLEGITASAAVAPGNVKGKEGSTQEDPPEEDEEEEVTAGADPQEGADGAAPAAPEAGTQEEEDEEEDGVDGSHQLLTILEQLTEQNARIIERQDKLEEQLTKMAARLKTAEGKVAKGAAQKQHPSAGNTGTPDASRAEAAFRRKAKVLRPGNEVKQD